MIKTGPPEKLKMDFKTSNTFCINAVFFYQVFLDYRYCAHGKTNSESLPNSGLDHVVKVSLSGLLCYKKLDTPRLETDPVFFRRGSSETAQSLPSYFSVNVLLSVAH